MGWESGHHMIERKPNTFVSSSGTALTFDPDDTLYTDVEKRPYATAPPAAAAASPSLLTGALIKNVNKPRLSKLVSSCIMRAALIMHLAVVAAVLGWASSNTSCYTVEPGQIVS